MLKTELYQLIANGENSGVELQRDDVRPESLAKEIVALANFRGGHILLGVEDDGRISGLARPHTQTWVMDTVIGRYVHPAIIPFYEEIDLGAEGRVAVITLEQGTTKPYVVRNNDREDIYIRVGDSSRLATREQQARLFQESQLLRADELPVSGTRPESDRVEIASPGPLPNSITVEKMKAGQRAPRNPLLVDILRDYGYVDARGMGVRRRIIPAMRALTGDDPEYRATADEVRLILRLPAPGHPGA